ncbi:dirigent protein 2-like [Eucalyptus grandis]|uniref:dirigent protein 2-like n=1 Tax=Eucalyptus grandis TaxID=71139 RepID=UPI00192E95AE|nr:dirigent protein 2-like [Eucalyptus grandis]
MVLYFQDFAAGPNATLIPVAGIAGKLWTFSQFGTVFVTDDFITETPDPNSPMVGQGQGMYVTSALDGSSTRAMFSIVFTNQAYNGSTLEIQGTAKQFEAVREYSVVGDREVPFRTRLHDIRDYLHGHAAGSLDYPVQRHHPSWLEEFPTGLTNCRRI